MRSSLEERKRKANEEFQELLKWVDEESEKITEELERSGSRVYKLDGNNKFYKPLQTEFKRKVTELFDKYDLPNKPNRRQVDTTLQ